MASLSQKYDMLDELVGIDQFTDHYKKVNSALRINKILSGTSRPKFNSDKETNVLIQDATRELLNDINSGKIGLENLCCITPERFFDPKGDGGMWWELDKFPIKDKSEFQLLTDKEVNKLNWEDNLDLMKWGARLKKEIIVLSS